VTAETFAARSEFPELPERRAWPALRVGVVFVSVGVGATVLSGGDALLRPGWFAAFSLYNVAAFALVALLWLRLRPSSRVGAMLLGLSAICVLTALQGSSTPLVHSIGVLGDPILVLVLVYLLVTFPTIALTRSSAAVLALLFGTLAIGFVPSFFFSLHVAGTTPLAACSAGCPENALMVANRPEVAEGLSTAVDVGRPLFAVSCLLLLGMRFLTSTGPRRRVLAPVYAVALAWLAAFGAYGVAMSLVGNDSRFLSPLAWVLTGARVALPLGFAVAILSARVFASMMLTTMLPRLRAVASAGELQRVAGDALGDPDLRLVFWRSESSIWVDGEGASTSPPAVGSDRGWREVYKNNGSVRVALTYDAALDEDPELLDATTLVLKLRLDALRLESQLQMSFDELGDLARRSAAISDEQLRRVERDLHDSAQQRLVVVAMDMERLRTELRADGGTDAELARLGSELELALMEIRDVAHGSFPASLDDLGLRAALADALRSNARVALRVERIGRYAREVETAVYFALLEAVQNAMKHGSAGVRARASVWAGERDLSFEVSDDGPGFDAESARRHGGLAGLEQRLASVGGTLDIISMPGVGTVVRGHVPVGDARPPDDRGCRRDGRHPPEGASSLAQSRASVHCEAVDHQHVDGEHRECPEGIGR
jgi:signal transduction histidine kinase